MAVVNPNLNVSIIVLVIFFNCENYVRFSTRTMNGFVVIFGVRSSCPSTFSMC